MRRFLAPFMLVLATCFLPSCASANPVAAALKATPENRPETVAAAIYNSYIVVATHAANIAEDSTTPREVKKAIIALHETASPALKRLRQTALDFKSVREAYNSGTSTLEKYNNALAALTAAINNAAPKANALASEVASAGSGGSI